MAKDAPLAFVVCGDLNKAISGAGMEYWVQDASAATENLLLAAQGLGLGAVWSGVYPMEERVKEVQKILLLPKDIIPLNVIPIGYPLRIHFRKINGNRKIFIITAGQRANKKKQLFIHIIQMYFQSLHRNINLVYRNSQRNNQ